MIIVINVFNECLALCQTVNNIIDFVFRQSRIYPELVKVIICFSDACTALPADNIIPVNINNSNIPPAAKAVYLKAFFNHINL